MYRSAPLMAFVLRQLGATVGRNLQCAHDADLSGPLDLISIEDDVAIQTGAYIQTTEMVGAAPARRPDSPRKRLQDRDASRHRQQCDGGPRQLDHSVHTHPRQTSARRRFGKELPRASAGRCTELKRTASACRYASSDLATGDPQRLHADLPVLWISVVPTAAILWLARAFHAARRRRTYPTNYFSVTPLFEIVWHLTLYTFITAWLTIVVTSLLGCLFIRWTAASPGCTLRAGSVALSSCTE